MTVVVEPSMGQPVVGSRVAQRSLSRCSLVSCGSVRLRCFRTGLSQISGRLSGPKRGQSDRRQWHRLNPRLFCCRKLRGCWLRAGRHRRGRWEKRLVRLGHNDCCWLLLRRPSRIRQRRSDRSQMDPGSPAVLDREGRHALLAPACAVLHQNPADIPVRKLPSAGQVSHAETHIRLRLSPNLRLHPCNRAKLRCAAGSA